MQSRTNGQSPHTADLAGGAAGTTTGNDAAQMNVGSRSATFPMRSSQIDAGAGDAAQSARRSKRRGIFGGFAS